MRILRIALLGPMLGACADGAVIEGTLLEGDDAARVWVEGVGEPVPIEGSAFRLERVTGDTIDLMFGDEGDPAGRMRLLAVGRGARVVLNDVWFEDEIAFPTSIELEGGGPVTINGLRMGGPDRSGDGIEARGTVLAVSGDGDHLVIRPLDGGLPDLRVVAGSAAVASVDGEPARADRLEYGDTVEVRGRADGSYLIASEVTVPRAVAAGVEAATAEEDADPPAVARGPTVGRDGGRDAERGKGGGGREARDRDRPPPPARDGWPGRGRGRGRD